MTLARLPGLYLAIFVLVFVYMEGTAAARPVYGNHCSNCHGTAGFGITVPNAVVDVVGTSQSTIPSGEFGDPDRGVGPLSTYTAVAGGTFNMLVQIKDTSTYSPPFVPTRWALALQDIFHTDPDYQNADPDPLNWRDAQLLMNGAMPPGGPVGDPVPIPLDASEWSLYTNISNEQYYATTADGGHAWIGAFLLSVTVTVPAGVWPGWYDLEISAAGWDYDQSFFAFYDDEHFYLNVLPEPGGLSLLLIGALVMLRRTRSARAPGAAVRF
jgi:hypothetical protein